MSTACVVNAWTIVLIIVTNRMLNRLVPTTTPALMPRIYSIAGTRMKPPPTPINIVRMPTATPRISGASGEM